VAGGQAAGGRHPGLAVGAPRTDWKTGVCTALRWGDPADGARRVLGAVRSYRDLETPLIGAVERLIDFVTADGDAATTMR
jgi:hypothetical protein